MSSFWCNPSCNHMRFLRVIRGGIARFVDLIEIKLSFSTTHSLSPGLRVGLRCKPMCVVL